MNAESQRDGGHDDQRHGAGGRGFSMHEGPAEIDHGQKTGKVQPVPSGKKQRLAADIAGELAERDHGTGEGHGADQHADVNLDLVNGFFGAGELHRRIDVAGVTDRAGGEADQAVHQSHQLGHLRHAHRAGGIKPNGGADQHGAGDPADTGRGDSRPGNGGGDGDCHAYHAEHVTPARGFRVGQPAKAQDEQYCGSHIGSRCEILIHCRPPICGTLRACGE